MISLYRLSLRSVIVVSLNLHWIKLQNYDLGILLNLLKMVELGSILNA
jgi:hypothetical protein